MLQALNNSYIKSRWTKENTAHLTLKDLRSLFKFNQFSTTEITLQAFQTAKTHYDVTDSDDKEAKKKLVQMMSSNDRKMLGYFVTVREAGVTDQIHQVVEKAWAGKAAVEHKETTIQVEANMLVTSYKDVIFPVLANSRPGMAPLVNAMCCMAYVQKGTVKEITKSDDFTKVYRKTLVVTTSITNYVSELKKLWDGAKHMRSDVLSKNTYRGLECASAFTRLLSGCSHEDYLVMHTLLVTNVLNIFVMKGDRPTDTLIKVKTADGAVPVCEPTSISVIPINSKGEWGLAAQAIQKSAGILPKVLVGPIKIVPKWLEEEKPTALVAKAASVGAVTVRGGEKSYWTKMMKCSALSVTTDNVNRMRLLVAMAAGVLRKDGTKVQISIDSSQFPIIESSLKAQKFAADRIYYLVTADAKVKMMGLDARDRILCVSALECVHVAIADTKMPGTNKEKKVDTVFPATMNTYRKTIQQDSYLVWTPVFSDTIEGAHIVMIRPPHDFYAMLTTDPEFVESKYFPNKKVIKTFELFCTEVVAGSSSTFCQMFAPLKLRSTSLELLNILVYDVDTTRIRIGKNHVWEYVGVDGGTFDDGDEAGQEYDDDPPVDGPMDGGTGDKPKEEANFDLEAMADAELVSDDDSDEDDKLTRKPGGEKRKKS